MNAFLKQGGIFFSMLEEKEKIFQPFVRFHGCSAFVRSGIGLEICERIVARNHGKIKVFN
jgi:signal transduction histidine kinase